jgi:hypothetical protein
MQQLRDQVLPERARDDIGQHRERDTDWTARRQGYLFRRLSLLRR